MSTLQVDDYFRAIGLPDVAPFDQYTIEPADPAFSDRDLYPLARVNLFVGPNNTGKSRLLRGLFRATDHTYAGCRVIHDHGWDVLQQATTVYRNAFTYGSIRVDYDLSNLPKELFTNTTKSTYNGLSDEELADLFWQTRTKWQKIGKKISQNPTLNTGGDPRRTEAMIEQSIASQVPAMLKALWQVLATGNPGFVYRYYMPILRGMRPLNENMGLYELRTRQDYFHEGSFPNNAQVVTGLDLYRRLKLMLLGKPDQRKRVQDFESFLGNHFFQGETITLIPFEPEASGSANNPNIVEVKIGQADQYPIYNLGDGLQNIITIFFSIFMAEQKSLFFVEEPDIFLHPSMQRAFLKVLGLFPQHQFFLTTHSNHLLDMTLDFKSMAVFHFSRQPGNSGFTIKPTRQLDRNVLRGLGVQSSSVFLSNATIWVEGKTDRHYIRGYMERYLSELQGSKDPSTQEKYKSYKDLREDFHYSFVEYQGAGLAQWVFDETTQDSNRIRQTMVCSSAIVIADGDIGSKGDRMARLEKELGNNVVILPGKEIENLLPDDILRELIASTKGEMQGIDTVKYSDYVTSQRGLGEYLDLQLNVGKFRDTSGTLKPYYKARFCERAIDILQTKDDSWSLPNAVRELCERVFQHILTCNTTA